MKNLLLVLILITSSSAMANNYGLRLGINQPSANVDTNATGNQLGLKEEIGFSIGAFYERKISEKLRLSIDLAYSTYEINRSNIIIPGTGYIQTDSLIEYSYLTIRPTISYNVTKGLGLIGGLTIETPLSADSTETTKSSLGVGTPTITVDNQDIKSDSETIRASLNLGIDYRLELEKLTLIPRLMYQMGLNPNYDANGTKIEIDAFIFDLGVLF